MSEQAFRDAFPAIAALIDQTEQHLIQVTRSLAGSESVVIVKRRDNARGWGLAWFAEANELRGMRGLRYVADASALRPGGTDSSSSNAEFLAEFRRRLSITGESLLSVEGGADYEAKCFVAASRAPTFNWKNWSALKPPLALRRQLQHSAF